VLFFLKWMGALVGFGMVALALWLMGLAIYYTGWSKLTGLLDGAAAVGPLFMAYVAGGRIPTDRYKLFNGKLRLHPTDTFFGVLFLIAPWMLMGMVLVAHDQFATPAFGGVVAVLLGGMVIWGQSTLTKGQHFWIIGVACPLLCFWLLRQEFYPIYPPPLSQLLLGVLAWVYVQSFFVYWIALLLWRPGKWGWRQWGRTTAEFCLILSGMGLTLVQAERGTVAGALSIFTAVLAAVIVSVWKSGKAPLDLSNPANES
jgi:hypothetical protein